MRRLQLIAMTDDPDAQVRIAAFHALACDLDAHVRAMAAELAGKFVHTDSRAVTALETAHAQDPSAPPSTSGPSHTRPGNWKALSQTTREWTCSAREQHGRVSVRGAAQIGFSDTARVVDKADRNDLCVADREGHE